MVICQKSETDIGCGMASDQGFRGDPKVGLSHIKNVDGKTAGQSTFPPDRQFL